MVAIHHADVCRDMVIIKSLTQADAEVPHDEHTLGSLQTAHYVAGEVLAMFLLQHCCWVHEG